MKRAMRRRKTWQRQAAAITAAMMAMSVGGIAYAMPQGEVIRSGKGEITRQDKDMTVNQDSKRLAIDWSGFDIANDERVTFRQPDKDSVALNRVVGDAASVIDGTLSGNGHVYVVNPNGVLFGKNASVDVGSLVASTARISDSDMTNFANADGITMAIPEDSSAKVINAGTIRAEGGLVVLHAAEVENSGTITNPEGTTALAAVRNLSLSADTAGKINFTVDGALAKAKALNSGMLKADGGYLVMTARSAGDVMSTVVNNTGTMEAKTLRQNEKGEILLDGGDNGIVELNGTLDASGMEAGQSAGSIKAIGAETHVEDGATLHAIGAVDGGLIETSGDYLEIGDNVDIDAAGKTGKAGEWLLVPLDVVISASRPDNATAGNATDNTDGRSYSLGNVTNESRTSWVNSKTVSQLLSKGTNVRVESADINKAASISVNSTIEKTGTKEASFTLEAQRNITINKDITAKDGKLNVTLNSDTDGDAIGAVIINANIKTNGGNFTSGSGGTRHYDRYNRLIGAGNPSKGTVGTYFGNGGATGNRSVTTNGGAVNLYGDVAIGLNGGKLTIDTTKEDGTGGLVNITGTIESGNSYTLYYQGKAGWDDLVKKYAMEHGFETTATKYTGTDSKTIKKGDYYCIISEDGLSVKWYKATKGSSVIGTKQYINYTSSQVTINKTYTAEEYNRLSATDKSDMSHRIANSWEAAKWLAQNGTGGGSAVNDTYLATITSSLENSLAAPTGEIPLFVGGKGSGSPVSPIDSEHSDGYYWVTGPEGEAPGGKGTKFADNSGTPLQNYYAKWHTGDSETSHSTTTEPNNSGPYVTVGYGVTSNWDDVATSAGTTKGFVQEKNLAHSGLEVQAGSGRVDLKGNAGLSVGLKNLTINTTGNVTVGGGRSAAGTTYTGQIRTDEGVSIHGADVTVGDRITSINNGVDIQATGNINVDGITAHENINLTTTDGSIVLNKEYNDGSLNTESQDNDAVVIDVQGKDGSFQNLTSEDVPTITTGTGGNWKVYSYSPDADTFGTNLNSGINAQWGATSTSYSASEHDGDKYIFQVKPTVYVTAKDMKKVYGEVLTNDNVTTTAEATFTGQDNKEHKVNAYTDAFTEGDVSDYYNGSGTFTSEGWAKTATRTGGDKAPVSEPENNAIYNIKATSSESYNLTAKGTASGYADATTKDGGTVEILRRQINVNGSGSQTYGNATINDWKLTAALTGKQEGATGEAIVNDDKLDESTGNLSIKSGSSYAENQAGRMTADANPDPYEDAVNMENVGFENGAGVNYEIVKAKGDLKVNKANLTITTNGFKKVYGDVEGVQNALKNAVTVTGLTNGDNNGESTITVDGTSEALIDVDGEIRTNNVKDGGYDIDAVLATDLQNTIHTNYNVTPGTGKAVLTKKGITLITDDINTTYGDGNTIRDKLNNNLLHLEGLTSWDEESKVMNELSPDVSVDMTDSSASPYKIVDGKPATDADGNLYTNNAKTPGYSITTGDYDVAQNYQVVETKVGHVNIAKADLQVKVGNAKTVYGTPFDTSQYTYSYENLVNGDTAAVVDADLKMSPKYTNTGDGTDGRATQDAGEYSLTIKPSSFNSYLKNYNVTNVLSGVSTVTRAPYTITVGNIEATYGDYKTLWTKLKNAGTISGLTNGDEEEYSSTFAGTSDALLHPNKKWYTNDVGDYAINKDIPSELQDLLNKNYELVAETPGRVYLEKAALVINTDDKTTTYGTVDKAFTSDIKGLTNGDDKSIVNLTYATDGYLSDTKTNDVGDYDITTSVNALKNYDVKTNTANLHINKAALTINTDDKTTTYGTVDKAFTSDIQGLTNGDDKSIVNLTYATDGYLSDTKTNDVGDYDITTSVNALKNYDVKTNTANLHINKAALVVNTEDKTTTYGTVDKAFTSDIKGLTNGDDKSIVNLTYATDGYLSDTKTNDVGDYDITTSVNDLKNYDVTTNTANLHIKQADLTIQIGNASTVYGTKFDESQYGYSYASGITNGDTEATLDAALGGMNYTNDAALDGTNGKWTKDVGDYALKGEGVNGLKNYKVTYLDGTATVTPLNITEDNVNDFITNATYTTVYGSKADFGQAVFTGVNGDGTHDLSITGSSALTGNTEGVITKDAAENAYNTVVSLDGLSAQDKKNYGLEDTSSFTFDNSATVEKADLTVSRKGIETVYGTVKKDPGDMTTYTTLVNGDKNDIVIDNGNYGTAYNDDLTKTNNVGKYDYKATLNSASDVLRNYNVIDKGTNYVNITPYTITEQEVVNLDGSPLYTTKYGQKDAFGTATFTGVNGDGTYELAITDSSALATAGAGKVTKDVGKNIYDTTVELSEAMNGNYQFADGATSKTFEKTASVTPAELTIKTKDVETEYGTVKTTTSEVDGLRNGDLPTGFIYDYGNYGGAYLDGNTKTNDVNTYHFGTTLSGAEFLKNYTITGGEADVKIDPKDVTFFVSGTGNTLTDVTYTVDPDIDAQLAYGEQVDADYTPGNDLGSNQYGVVAHINGTPIVTGDVAGNYRYNYGGLITLSPTVPTKPDIDPHNPSNLDGSGSWTSNMGNHGVPGVERVAGLASAELPFFKVEAGQVSHYGTYDVAADPDKVRLEPTGKRLPEPNQPKTQYREYTKALTTTDGTGMFRMVYDGSTFNITPVDDGALALMRMGDVKNNVELSAEALHAGFSEMGILLEDLDGVYVHFDTMA